MKTKKISKFWSMLTGSIILSGISLILIFLLSQAADNRVLYEKYYNHLFITNIIIAILLSVIIAWGAITLYIRLKKGKFGSYLLLKLAGIFAVVGFLPGVLIYTVSYQFAARSIESWFDIKVEGALESGLTLARTSIETQAREFGIQTQLAAAAVAQAQDVLAPLQLEQWREQIGALDVTLWNINTQQAIASAGQSRFELTPQRPSASLVRRARIHGIITQIEGLEEASQSLANGEKIKEIPQIRAIAYLPVNTADLLGHQRVLQAIIPLPTNLVNNALSVEQANREYQERSLGKQGLRRMYIGTLTLTLLLAVFAAILLALILGKQLLTPLLLIAEGVHQVAEGDLGPKTILNGKDELGGLTRDFANMTRQLAETTNALSDSMQQEQTAREHVQAILDTMTAGVIVLNPHGIIQTANPSAARILRIPLEIKDSNQGQTLAQYPDLAEFAEQVNAQFEQLQEQVSQLECTQEKSNCRWQKSFELYSKAGGALAVDTVSIIARGVSLKDPANQNLRLLVFDDISEIVSAQRTKAWGEVARRLAHEIKNPLTPIQLSAERLEIKLEGKLPPVEQALVKKSVKTIVEQVAAMQRLVNEFRDYARLPTAQLAPLNLNELIADILELYTGTEAKINFDPDKQSPKIMGDAGLLRQVVHNLLQNAIDATTNGEPIQISTNYIPSTQKVCMKISDSGSGFSPVMLGKIFEPYVTTKAKGTGLGLAVVKKISDEHNARIDITNRVKNSHICGAQVSLSLVAAINDFEKSNK